MACKRDGVRGGRIFRSDSFPGLLDAVVSWSLIGIYENYDQQCSITIIGRSARLGTMFTRAGASMPGSSTANHAVSVRHGACGDRSFRRAPARDRALLRSKQSDSQK